MMFVPDKSTENNGKNKRLNLSSRVIHNCEEYRMESTSKTMSALHTKSNANSTSEMPIGIVTEIGTQEISAKAEFISQERSETKSTGGELTRYFRITQIGDKVSIKTGKMRTICCRDKEMESLVTG
jgi:hypothetical protein